MRRAQIGFWLLTAVLAGPTAGYCGNDAAGEIAPQDLEAANAALLSAEAELLNKLDKAPAQQQGAILPNETAKAALRNDAGARAAEPKKEGGAVKQPAEAPPQAAQATVHTLDTLHGENSALKNQVKFQGKTVETLQAENISLRRQLAETQGKMKALLATLEERRNRLMVAETEVERLNVIVENLNGSSGRPQRIRRERSYSALSPSQDEQDALLTTPQQEKVSEDMPIATVIVEKANLRLGPGMEHSPVMSVAKGTRLAIETKSGDWYRVVAPTGQRAWIAKDTVAYGKDAKSSPSRTVRVKSYDPSIEDEAMELVRRAGAGRHEQQN